MKNESKAKAQFTRDSDDLLIRLFRNSPIGAYIVRDGKFIFTNKRFQETADYNEDELKETCSLNLVHPEDRERVRESAIKMLKGECLSPYQYRTLGKDGRTRYAIETVVSIQFRGRRASLGEFMDITELKVAEEALQRSEQNLRNIINACADGILIIGKDGNGLFANPAAEAILGKKSAEIAGKPIGFPITAGKGKEIKITRSDGEPRTIEARAANIEWEGRKALLASLRDITERRKMEQQLLIADRMAATGELVAGIAHEVNNPLTSVIGFAQLILEGDVPEEVKKDVEIIYGEAQRAAKVLENLLTFARQHTPYRHPVDLNEILGKVLEMRAYEQQVRNIRTATRLALYLPKIMADYLQLLQCFTNIVINAEYFMSEAHNGGTLTVTTKMAENNIKISFADDGPGISPENMGHIFDPFFTTKRTGKGTGLGLSICHGIITEHGGRIYAESEPGRGATLFVELPALADSDKFITPTQQQKTGEEKGNE